MRQGHRDQQPAPPAVRRAPAAAARAWRAAPAAFAAAASLGLAACAPHGLSPADRSELDNMWRGYQAPKSTASQLVSTFDDICVATPRKNAEAALRDASYVPLPQRTAGARGWVVDDLRPAVALSDRMCVVRAKSRSGQTAAFTGYVSDSFPGAQPLDPASFGENIEAAWRVPGPAIVASERQRDIDFFVYTLIYYTPEAG